MNPAFVRSRIKRWEVLRLPFNAVCVVGAWLAWNVSNDFTVAIDESPPAYLSDPGALRDMVLGFAVLNIAYCLVYAVEFAIAARADQSWSRGARIALFSVGCAFGFVIAGRGASGISSAIASEKRGQMIVQENIERMRQQKPNKALEPTPTAVTSPAAQEPRQP
jgi:hypothetical protein